MDDAVLSESEARELSAVLAPYLPDALIWLPAVTCRHGHDNLPPETALLDGAANDPGSAIGELCSTCVVQAEPLRDRDAFWAAVVEHQQDPTWHPEWRLTAGEPVDWTDERVVWRAWEAWAPRHPQVGEPAIYREGLSRTVILIWSDPEPTAWHPGHGPTTATALALAWLSLLHHVARHAHRA